MFVAGGLNGGATNTGHPAPAASTDRFIADSRRLNRAGGREGAERPLPQTVSGSMRPVATASSLVPAGSYVPKAETDRVAAGGRLPTSSYAGSMVAAAGTGHSTPAGRVTAAHLGPDARTISSFRRVLSYALTPVNGSSGELSADQTLRACLRGGRQGAPASKIPIGGSSLAASTIWGMPFRPRPSRVNREVLISGFTSMVSGREISLDTI